MLVLIKCYGITPRGQHQLYADADTRGGLTCPHAHITAASGASAPPLYPWPPGYNLL